MKKYRFDEHGVGYKLGKTLQKFRPQFSIILGWIPNKSKVLDLGCGDGVLGEKLAKEKTCSVFGFDLDEVAVKEAKRRGIKSKLLDMDDGLPYPDKYFDICLLSDVLQYSSQPDFVISEALRVGKKVIIEFPNFGFWCYRLQTLLGHFPSLSLYGHSWYQTRQTKFFSLSDFLNLAILKKAHIKRLVCIDWKNRQVSWLARLNPNLFGRSCILLLDIPISEK